MSRMYAAIVLLFGTLLLPMYSLAVETVPDSLRALIVIGLEENIGLQVEQFEIPVSAETVEIEASAFDPELFASVGFSKSQLPISSSLSLTDHSDSEQLKGQLGLRKKYFSGLMASLTLDSEWVEDNNLSNDLAPRYRSALNLTLTQPLLRDFGAKFNRSNLELSRNRYRQSTLRHLLRAQELALQIEVLATKLTGGEEIVELRSEAVTLAKNLYSANQQRFDAGVIPVSEVQEAETALASRELELSLARQSLELAFEQLYRLLNYRLPRGFDPALLYELNAEDLRLTLPEFEKLYTAARKKNINLQLGEFAIKDSVIQHDYYQNQLKPRLDLNIQAGLNGLSGDLRNLVNSRYVGSWGESLGRAATADGYQWGAGLTFSLPLGNRTAKSRLRLADLQRQQSNYRQRDQEATLKSKLQQDSMNLKRAFEQVKIAERFEQLAELSLQQEQRRLDEGLSDTFRMIFFQGNMINAKIGRINSLVHYFSAVAQLNFTRGIILEQHNITLMQDAEENNLEIM